MIIPVALWSARRAGERVWPRVERVLRSPGYATRKQEPAKRWFDKRTGDHLALDTGGGPIARFWATALAGMVDIGYVKATGKSVKIYLPKTATLPDLEFEWKIPKWSNAIERDRAYFQAYAAACALHFVEKALKELHAGRTRTWMDFKVPQEAIGCGFHEAVRGVLSHHVVIRGGKIANNPVHPVYPCKKLLAVFGCGTGALGVLFLPVKNQWK